jgi:hypothetical protein
MKQPARHFVRLFTILVQRGRRARAYSRFACRFPLACHSFSSSQLQLNMRR